ncbi:MAG: carboxypeptidase-like regulatory domain-containing protein [Thermonemataceae bacterium]
MAHYLLFFSLFLLAHIAQGQNLTQTIKGRIFDAFSKQPVVGAQLTIVGTDPLIGAVTDTAGYFVIEAVPVGRQVLKVVSMGYAPVSTNLLINSSSVYQFDLALKTTQVDLDEVIISPNISTEPLNNMAKVSARSFSLEQSQRFAGALSDPSRVAYSFPGVTFGAPQDNGVVIRGNTPTNVLWRLEGVEIPGAAHFAGGNLAGAGLITIYSANLLGTSDFFTGAFPAEYGNATAGVFDINFRRGNTEKTNYTAQLGVLGADIAVEGPLNKEKNGAYLANYRHGFIGYYGALAGGVEPHYQDLSFKIDLPHNNKSSLSVWGIGGISSIFTPYGEYENEEGEIERRETEGDFQQDDIAFDMMAVGIKHNWQLNKTSFLNTSLAFSTNGYDSNTQWFNPIADTLNTGTLSPYTDLSNRESKATFTTNLSKQFSQRINTTSGVIVDYLTFNAKARQAPAPNQPLDEFLNNSGETFNLQLYTQADFIISSQLSLQMGVNWHYFYLNQEATLEPRLGLSWEALPKVTFSLGYGRHSRRQELKVYYFDYLNASNERQNNEHLQRVKADHFVLGATWALTETLRFNVEGYYQDLFDVPVVPDSSYSFVNYTQLWELDSPLNNEGTGYNRGVDISLEQTLRNGYYYLLTVSLFDARYTGGDGIERNTLYNRNYLTTLTLGREFLVNRKKKNRVNLLGINVNATYMGGQRLTPFLLQESQNEQQVVLDDERLYSLQSDPELWLNANVTYRINRKNTTTTWGLDFQNALLTEQLQGYEYNFLTNTVEEERVLFILPNLYYRLEF